MWLWLMSVTGLQRAAAQVGRYTFNQGDTGFSVGAQTRVTLSFQVGEQETKGHEEERQTIAGILSLLPGRHHLNCCVPA